MKKHLCVILSLFALVFLMTGCGAKTVASGKCGEYLTWTLDDCGKLTISAEEVRKAEASIMEENDVERMDVFDEIEEQLGLMADYSPDIVPPWYEHRESITSVIVEDGVSSIGNGAFLDCVAIESVRLPESVHSIGNRGFALCRSLKSISLPTTVTKIDAFAFAGCWALESISIPNRLESIAEDTFMECKSLSEISIPNGVASIEFGAFASCSSAESIRIPESVTRIDAAAFSECSSLKSITIPASVTSIDITAFMDCTLLQDVYFEGTSKQWEQALGGFSDILKDFTGYNTVVHTNNAK